MKKLQSSLGVKFAAVVLLTLAAAAAALAGGGLLYARETGIMAGKTSYYESDQCRSECSSIAWYIANSYAEGMDADGLKEAYSGASVNTDFSLADMSGAVIVDTIDPKGSYSQKEAFSMSFRESGGGENAPETKYTVTVAVKQPMPVRSGPIYTGALLFGTVAGVYSALVPTLAAALFIFLICCVYLAWAAGHKAGAEGIHLNWQDKIPLDLYLALDTFLVYGMAEISLNFCFGAPDLFSSLNLFGNVLGAVLIVLGGLLALAAVMTMITRGKAGKWWRNTIIFRVLRRVYHGAKRGARLLPMVWRTFLIVGAVLFLDFLFGVGTNASAFWLLLAFVMDAAALAAACWGAMQMRGLKKAGEELAAGNLSYQTNTDKLYWDFKRHAEDLNSISEGMAAAVEQRMRSEHFKTELITNVSHDIKTPLTSIVSYVDLLQKPHTEEENAQYLDVLARQSARLKKLIEDLVEASKASTGNLTVELAPTNLTELLNQSLGEYESKFAGAGLELVTSMDEGLTVMADGKRLWRVLDNLLGNVCKYALRGTRVYVTAEKRDGQAAVSVKNISRQQLNISADELMERFVRGDSARATEGSGLGLNIAQSLIELQGGALRVSIDGDLFRATLVIPLANR